MTTRTELPGHAPSKRPALNDFCLSQVVYPATRDNYTFSAKVASDGIELGTDGAVTLEIEITYDDGSVETKEYDLY